MEKLTSIWQIDERIVDEIFKLYNENEEIIKKRKMGDISQMPLSYGQQLHSLFSTYMSLLKEYSLDEDSEDTVYQLFEKKLKKNIKEISNLFEFYSKGKLNEAYKIENRLFATVANRDSVASDFPRTTIDKEKYWFRSRRPEFDNKFNRLDLFHVPFEKRGTIGSSRYSIPGFPCLYLGSTMECAKEETGDLTISAISCFKNLIELNAFDFCFFPPINKAIDKCYLIQALISYPFKIAASIPVGTYKDSYIYIEEYAIPQLLLHCTIRKNGQNKPQCIMFSSTKAIVKQVEPENYTRHVNIAVPAFFIRSEGACGYLSLKFSLTEPEIVPFDYLEVNQLEEIEENMKRKEFKTI